MSVKSDNRLYSELEASLKDKLGGEVYFDSITRTLYSTDASNYQIEPVGVVIPKNEDDIAHTLEIASKYDVAILPRGSGSSLAGQAVGQALVVDLSKYINQILEVNVEEKTVRVQSGMFLDQLNQNLLNYGLKFGPDPSSAKIATIGGVVGNNATGAHSILYGMAGDNVAGCNLFLGGGEKINLTQNINRNPFLEKLEIFREKQTEKIKSDFPKHWRRASGYSLNYFLDDNFNPAKLLAGSEGTLGLATEFTLNLVDKPRHTALAILEFETTEKAMESVPHILEAGPSAIELIDRYLLDLTRANPSYSRLLTFVEGNPEAILIVEFDGRNESEAEKKTKNLDARLKSKKVYQNMKYAFTAQSQTDVWEVRKAGLGLLMSKRSEFKPIPCIEDVSVPVEKLPDYIRDINALLKRLDTDAGFYGHASAGCLHIRPLVNLKSDSGINIMKELTEESFKMALKYGGVMSGEHGDGLQRSYLSERLFGEGLYSAMKELKSIFDPGNIFNPGKVVDGPLPTENLRFGESYRPLNIKTFLDWSSDNGFSGAVEMCSGQGVCRKIEDGIMCPSYMATRNERDTTRARANILRALVSGSLPKDLVTSKEMHDVFDLCLSCKACKSECPSSVDAAKMKLEFLGQYHIKHGFSLRDKMFGYIHNVGRLTSIVKPFSILLMNNGITKYLLSNIGITSRRSLPTLSEESFTNWFKNRSQPANVNENKKVIYFHDTWVSYYHTHIGKAAVQLLEAAGFEVVLVEKRVCCGRPMLSNGMIEQARHMAKKNVSLLAPYVNEGIPVVGTEPSCILTFRDEYLDLLPDNDQAKALSESSYMLDEFLYGLQQSNNLRIDWKESGPEVFYHGHCHQRSLIGNTSALEMLLLSGCGVTESKAGCCGMAGSFGYESEHYDISKKIAEDRLIPAIKNSAADTVIAVSGVSCHHQIEDFSDRKVKHIAQVLADQMR